MLRISRRAGERIMLGDDVVIEVMEVRGQTVRIGIDAPRALPIYREEIWLEVKRENQAAAEAPVELPKFPATGGGAPAAGPGATTRAEPELPAIGEEPPPGGTPPP
jgi:carbon storage regulator